MEVERTELTNRQCTRREQAFRRRQSEVVYISPDAAKEETFFVVNDQGKTEIRSPKMIVEELNRLNQRLKPRNVKEKMLKTGTYVCAC